MFLHSLFLRNVEDESWKLLVVAELETEMVGKIVKGERWFATGLLGMRIKRLPAKRVCSMMLLASDQREIAEAHL